MRSAGMPMIDLAAVILVGGLSSRMGQDKATLPYKGKRLVDVVADAVRAAGIPRIYVSGMIDGYTSIPDMISGCGPVSGICSCLLRLSANHARLLFIPVDMPHLTPELLQVLIARPAHEACCFERHPLPCILPIHKETLRYTDLKARALAQKQKISVKDFLAGIDATSLAVPESLKPSLKNTNTPEEWQEATHESAH